MPKFAANITTLFRELPLLERFAAAQTAGFPAVEVQSPYQHEAGILAEQLERADLALVLFNAPMGDVKAGERGFAALPGREADFAASIEIALRYARALHCTQIHIMAGNAAGARAAQEAVFVANLQRAADRAVEEGVTLLIEPLNARDNPGYFLCTTTEAIAALDRINRRNVALQFDLYHCQISEGDLAEHLKRLFGRYAHIQIANVPGRHEPDHGEINFPYLFDLMDTLGYGGWIGCEYFPRAGTFAGLGWGERWGIGR
jgi:2-dehydrotetronate isomerase